MKQPETHRDLSADLRRILDCTTTSAKQKEVARSLLSRFETPISICVFGPDEELTDFVRRSLSEHCADPAVLLWKFDGMPPANQDAFAKVDMAIWCSLAFDPVEERIWAQSPDLLKDRSILIRFSEDGSHDVPAPVRDLFDEVVLASLSTPEDALSQLSSRVLQRVHAGRNADADSAAFLIESCDLPASEALSQPNATPLELAQIVQPLLPQLDAILSKHAAELNEAKWEGEQAATHVLSACETVLQNISDAIGVAPYASVPIPFLDDVQDLQDRVLLMTIEGGTDAAIEAISCLIQLRKELHLEVAA